MRMQQEAQNVRDAVSGSRPSSHARTAIASSALTLLVALAAVGVSSLWRDDSRALDALLQPAELEAALEDGDYRFLPERHSMWVVNTDNGHIVHYKFVDISQGKVERSHVAQIDQSIFPAEETVYKVTERNLANYLWVGNVRTGDFQLWRRSVRDGRLVTDPNVVASSQQLMLPALRNSNPR